MIDLGAECPAWIREFSRFLPLKKLLFVYGNILDIISYPVRPRGGPSEPYWSENDLPGFFERCLLGRDYEIVAFFDPVDGLTFSNIMMEKAFNKIRSGKTPDSASGLPAPAPAPPAPAGSLQTVRPGKGDNNLNRVLDDIIPVLMNKTTSCAFVFNLASRLVTSPTHLSKEEREIFTKFLKASLKAGETIQDGVMRNNVIILICDKLNDLPSFLYINNPRARSIIVPRPDTLDRTRFIQRTYRAFFSDDPQPDPPTGDFPAFFAALTEGLTNYEMKSLVRLSLEEKIPLKNIRGIVERYKYGITESEWDKIDVKRLESAETHLKARVKGQDAAVASVLDIVKRAKIGLSAGSAGKTSRPRGVLFFAGPTGVGKTELAKALAELLFGNEDRCIRFDMSEYSAGHSDEKLMGAPPGYIGYEEGGQLTNAVRENPFSVLLFDEIEKAHSRIFDKFLQILDDGRLTDGKGETVYFSECIIVFTSNLGAVSTSAGPQGGGRSLVSANMSYSGIRETVMAEIRDYFNIALGRPEILNRFGDNFVIFDFIRPPVDRQIVDLLIKKLVDYTRENKQIEIEVTEAVRGQLTRLAAEKLHHGGRGVRNLLDSALVNPLNRLLFDKGIKRGEKVTVTLLIDNGPDAVTRFMLLVE